MFDSSTQAFCGVELSRGQRLGEGRGDAPVTSFVCIGVVERLIMAREPILGLRLGGMAVLWAGRYGLVDTSFSAPGGLAAEEGAGLYTACHFHSTRTVLNKIMKGRNQSRTPKFGQPDKW